ncbi:glycosyltransferase family 2 protein [Streptomyces sp. HNM0574]|uniref:glycosyltransferase family 2 protein n=1 Tax=Streptomyces sp. HNM0574 TaxID=2714954 RepID=UPI00146BA4BC|nr:glycosyltransferase family 2 protein [Streptomyces sp. HNM0574]NLU68707.1 glycosyltransferase family 2 protein [Streptomyces sp. HNM0574]
MRRSVTVIIPAHDEEKGLPATLDSVLGQTVPPDRVIVVDDASRDRTGDVARQYGVDVARPPANLGSKAKAQNHALPLCTTELVLAVDADTVLAPDYIERILPAFDDPDVVIAAGNVQTRFTRTVWERGRSVEYLFGFHWHRPIQHLAASPMVCSGCCSVFRRDVLVAAGGFPERTIVEDIDFTWTQQIAGRRARYVADAVAWAADPETLLYLRKQVWRWMAGFCQNVRLHTGQLIRHKPMLALWVLLAMLEIITAPVWWSAPLVLTLGYGHPVGETLAWWTAAELVFMIPPLVYAARRRKLPTWRVLLNIPCVYPNKLVNLYYAWKAVTVELLLVPLRLSQGLTVYEKGRGATPAHKKTPTTTRPRHAMP